MCSKAASRPGGLPSASTASSSTLSTVACMAALHLPSPGSFACACLARVSTGWHAWQMPVPFKGCRQLA